MSNLLYMLPVCLNICQAHVILIQTCLNLAQETHPMMNRHALKYMGEVIAITFEIQWKLVYTGVA